MPEDNFWDITNKPQTKTKLKILNNYLFAWAKILASQKWCNQMYYIDCFAGRGKYNNEGIADSVLGSPLIAMEIAKIIKKKYNKDIRCIFIEEDKKIFLELQKFVSPYIEDGLHPELIYGNVNKKIEDVIKAVSGRDPVFFFIDPDGIKIDRGMLEKAMNIPNVAKEFLVTYICKGVERCYALGKKCDEDLPISIQKKAIGNLRRIQKFFGDDWKYLTKEEKGNLKIYLNIVADHNDKMDGKYKLGAKIIDICYNSGRNKYYLIFLSRNANAKGIIEDIYIKIKIDGTLFSSFSKRQQKEMFQGKFDI
ncbi:MAG: three-Cys-motif partner protein TcmP [Patescibacteria group bacterium]|nr:three-Cys-motif partner protein TcmP [Patescibacteria group bacterium]MDD5294759.1 three-Cys-motif partner protein TcmP [Patescibacteria group bacterium]MDD5554700.1 three-Cys-motif partner protein TcmP [Patescibacteria group bacterium]